MPRIYFLVVVGLKVLASCCLLVKVTLSFYKLPELSYLVSLPTQSLASSSLPRKDRIQKDRSNPVHIITCIPPFGIFCMSRSKLQMWPQIQERGRTKAGTSRGKDFEAHTGYIHTCICIDIYIDVFVCVMI